MITTTYVTTTIPYVNAEPHIGFALELVQADALARYHGLLSHDVRFQTGTDDNAYSNVLSAEAHGVPVARFVDRNSESFRALCEQLDTSHGTFLRTSSARHHDAVAAFLSRLDAGDVYRGRYRGLYCPRCEDFYRERDAPDGRCPEHGTGLEAVEETNHFFRLSRYQQQIRELIATRRLEVVPAIRENEILRFVDRGLADFSISRPRSRVGGWGVPFPGDPDHVVYVWVDALVNYLTGLGYPREPELSRYWSASSRVVHVIGKNVWKFHAIYWPALLLSAGLEIPDRIFVHGFVTHQGRKISKSSGDAVSPSEYIRDFGAEAVRYYLLAHAHPYQDTDFSRARLSEVYRTDLANKLGNLCSRLTALAERAHVGGREGASPPEAPPRYHEHFERFRFDRCASVLWSELDRLNGEIATERPWERLGANEVDCTRRRLGEWIERLYAVAYWLAPLLPSTAGRIISALGVPEIRKCPPLFPRSEASRAPGGTPSARAPDSEGEGRGRERVG